MTYEMIAVFAREKAGLGAEWLMGGWEEMSREGLDAVKFTFAVAPLITRGKRKGSPNWKKTRRSDDKTVFFMNSEIKPAAIEWEKRTGQCAECHGKGREMVSWNHETGTKYRPCGTCQGTGLAQQQLLEAVGA